MLLIILAFVIAIVGGFFTAKLDIKGDKIKTIIAFFFTCTAVSVFFVEGLMAPISGFEKPVIEEYELTPIVNDSDIYIIEKSDGAVICRYINEDDKEELYTITNNVEVVTVGEEKVPVLKTSSEKAKKTIFTFALTGDKTEYTLYVPESNIERWQNEHVD